MAMIAESFLNSKIIILSFIIFIFIAYGLYEAKSFLTGPKIDLKKPAIMTVDNSDFEIDGRAQNISLLYLDGRQIFTDPEGNFKENILLARGINIIEVRAKDKFNREIKKTLSVVLK